MKTNSIWPTARTRAAFSNVMASAHPAVRGRAVGLLSSNQFFADSINPFILAPLIAAVGRFESLANVRELMALSAG